MCTRQSIDERPSIAWVRTSVSPTTSPNTSPLACSSQLDGCDQTALVASHQCSEGTTSPAALAAPSLPRQGRRRYAVPLPTVPTSRPCGIASRWRLVAMSHHRFLSCESVGWSVSTAAPLPSITRLSLGPRPLLPHASLLHNAALPSVPASRYAKAPLGACHRCAPFG